MFACAQVHIFTLTQFRIVCLGKSELSLPISTNLRQAHRHDHKLTQCRLHRLETPFLGDSRVFFKLTIEINHHMVSHQYPGSTCICPLSLYMSLRAMCCFKVCDNSLISHLQACTRTVLPTEQYLYP